MPRKPKVGIVGAGHNALVASWYLASAEHEVVIFEKTGVVGGAASTLTYPCGCYASDGANAFGMLDPQILRDLGLVDRGLSVLMPARQVGVHSSMRVPLFMHSDVEDTADDLIARTSTSRAEIINFTSMLESATQAVAALWDKPMASYRDFYTALDAAGHTDFIDKSIAHVLRKHLSNPDIQALFVAAASLYAASPYEPGTALSLLYLALSTVGEQPGWGIVSGGMGNLTQLMARAAVDAGVQISINDPVIQIHGGTDQVVIQSASGCYHFDHVLSNIDIWSTLRLMDYDVPSVPFDGACTKINLLLKQPLQFGQFSTPDADLARRTLFVCNTDLFSLEMNWLAYRANVLPKSPYVEIMPSGVIDSRSSCGLHTPLSLFVMYTPYELNGAPWRDNEEFVAQVFRTIEEISPGASADVVTYEALSPVMLEERWGMYRGLVDHNLMSLPYSFEQRIPPSLAAKLGARVALCGAGRFPGGLVGGRSGRNAARTLIGFAR